MHDGGVVDDLITYYLGPNRYRVVVNAATRDKDIAWIESAVTVIPMQMLRSEPGWQ